MESKLLIICQGIARVVQSGRSQSRVHALAIPTHTQVREDMLILVMACGNKSHGIGSKININTAETICTAETGTSAELRTSDKYRHKY